MCLGCAYASLKWRRKNNRLLPWAPKLKKRGGVRRWKGKGKGKRKSLLSSGRLHWHTSPFNTNAAQCPPITRVFGVCALPRKGRREQKSLTWSKHTKDRQPSVFLHFKREGKICPCQKWEEQGGLWSQANYASTWGRTTCEGDKLGDNHSTAFIAWTRAVSSSWFVLLINKNSDKVSFC